MSDLLAAPLRLPCGAVLPNRLAKAAMTEGLADPMLHATPRHDRLYRQWSEGGTGLLLTGNVQIDRYCLERPGNVAIAGIGGLEQLASWAKAGTVGGNHLWMQISHAGRQSPRYVTWRPVAPSEVQLKVLGNYGRPRALTEVQILDLIVRFAAAARTARETGFTGVQIHAAHGYLLSSFLSPVTNRRTDGWGGNIENRARMLIETLRATRKACGADFPIGVKLNSDDFRKGGFSSEDCLRVVELLNSEGVDLLEISGGTYEQPRLLGAEGSAASMVAPRESTQKREAYFIDYAEKIRKVATMPMMLVGGMRSRAAMEDALRGACDVVAIARPLVSDPAASRKLLAREIDEVPAFERELAARQGRRSRFNFMSYVRAYEGVSWYYIQIFRLADGLPIDPGLTAFRALLAYLWDEQLTAWKMRRARK